MQPILSPNPRPRGSRSNYANGIRSSGSRDQHDACQDPDVPNHGPLPSNNWMTRAFPSSLFCMDSWYYRGFGASYTVVNLSFKQGGTRAVSFLSCKGTMNANLVVTDARRCLRHPRSVLVLFLHSTVLVLERQLTSDADSYRRCSLLTH